MTELETENYKKLCTVMKWQKALTNTLTMNNETAYCENAVYALMAEWNGIAVGMAALLQAGIQNNRNNILILSRSAMEVNAQLTYLTSSKKEMLRKSVYLWMTSNLNAYLFNQQRWRTLEGLYSASKEEKYILLSAQRLLDIRNCRDDKNSVAQKYIEEFQAEPQVKDCFLENSQRYFIYWYKLAGRINTTNLVAQYAFQQDENLENNSLMKYNRALYNMMSNRAHGLSAILTKDYGDEIELELVVSGMALMFGGMCCAYRRCFPKKFEEYQQRWGEEIWSSMKEMQVNG